MSPACEYFEYEFVNFAVNNFRLRQRGLPRHHPRCQRIGYNVYTLTCTLSLYRLLFR